MVPHPFIHGKFLIYWAANELPPGRSIVNDVMDPLSWEEYVDIAVSAIGPILDYHKFKALDFSINDDRNPCRLALIALGRAYHHGLDPNNKIHVADMNWDHEQDGGRISPFRMCRLLVKV